MFIMLKNVYLSNYPIYYNKESWKYSVTISLRPIPNRALKSSGSNTSTMPGEQVPRKL